MTTTELLHHLDAMAAGGTAHNQPYEGFAEAAAEIRRLTATVEALEELLAEEREDHDQHVADMYLILQAGDPDEG